MTAPFFFEAFFLPAAGSSGIATAALVTSTIPSATLASITRSSTSSPLAGASTPPVASALRKNSTSLAASTLTTTPCSISSTTSPEKRLPSGKRAHQRSSSFSVSLSCTLAPRSPSSLTRSASAAPRRIQATLDATPCAARLASAATADGSRLPVNLLAPASTSATRTSTDWSRAYRPVSDSRGASGAWRSMARDEGT